MPHVIKTTVALDGRHPAREVASIGEEKESLLSVWEKHVNTVDKYVDNYLEENKELSGDKPIGLETGINLQNLNANEIAILLEQKK